jgi:HK97 family phage major capsid protein
MTTDELVASKLNSLEGDVRKFIDHHKQQLAEQGAQHAQHTKELSARLLGLEQHAVSGGGAFGGSSANKSLGELVTESEGFAALRKGGRSTGAIEVGSFKTVLSGPYSVGPTFYPVVAQPAQPRLPVRGLMPGLVTTSNLVEFPSEDSQTGGPGYQYPEGSDKSQTDFAYSLKQSPVVTLATWLACSRQLFDDSTAFSGYIDARLGFLVEQKLEHELLYGDGGSGHLRGLCIAATPASGGPGTNALDTIAQALSQLAAAGVAADSICLHPSDWWQMRTAKTSGSGQYIIGDPLASVAPQLWGLAVSLSTQMTVGHFLTGAFRNSCATFDRQAATVEVSREHSDYFVKNLVAILCEERLALCIFRPTAFVYGTVSGTGS